MGGSRGVTAGPRRPAIVGEAGAGQAREVWIQEVGLPSPGTRASSSNRSLHPHPGAGRGRRGRAGRVPAETNSAVPAGAAPRSAGVPGQDEGPRPVSPPAPGLSSSPRDQPLRSGLPKSHPCPALASLPPSSPSSPGNPHQFLPGPPAHQSRPSRQTPFTTGGRGGERAGSQRGTEGWTFRRRGKDLLTEVEDRWGEERLLQLAPTPLGPSRPHSVHSPPLAPLERNCHLS